MAEALRERIIDAVCAVLYVGDEDFVDGDATDLKDLGLDSVRFVLLMKQLGVDRESDLPTQLANELTVAAWVRVLETPR